MRRLEDLITTCEATEVAFCDGHSLKPIRKVSLTQAEKPKGMRYVTFARLWDDYVARTGIRHRISGKDIERMRLSGVGLETA